MFEELTGQLAELKEKGRNEEKWRKRLEQFKKELAEAADTRDRWRDKLADEEEDVRKLSGMSLSNLLATILGNKAEKLNREQRQVLEAKVKYDESDRTVRSLEQQIVQLEKQWQEVCNWKSAYDRAFQAKERQVLAQNGEIAELADRRAELDVQLKELEEAILAGQSVQSDLSVAEEELHSAKNWGTYDMLGGGMLSTHIKHNRIDEAMDHIYQAQRSLARFERELRDVGGGIPIEMEIGGMLTFADYFFDGLIADWLVQGRINETLAQVEQKQSEVGRLMHKLDAAKRKAENELAELTRKYVQIVENYG